MVSFGRLVSAVGALLFAGALLWGLGLCVGLVYAASGSAGAVLAVLLTPVTFAVVPWVAGLETGNWLPFVLNYGASLVGVPLILAGKALAGDYAETRGRRLLRTARVHVLPRRTLLR